MFSFSSTIATAPNLPFDIAKITGRIPASLLDTRTDYFYQKHLRPLNTNVFPKNLPDGYLAKSLTRKTSDNSIRHIANASPNTNCAVVEFVGAKFKGPASFSTFAFKTYIAFCAKKESVLETMAMML